MRRHQLLSVLLLIGLVACHQKKQFAPSLWCAYDVIPETFDTVSSRFRFLYLQGDSSFTQDFGRFYYGKWRLVNNDLYLTNQHNVTYVYHLPSIKETEIGISSDNQKTSWFQRQPSTPADTDRNPFSLENNRWRIPATNKEDVAGIRNRLLDHFHFWELYFKWAADEHPSSVEVADIPSPLKIYGNGFGLKSYANLPARWKSCFFDTADCHTADTLIKGCFHRNKIAWPKTDDDLELYISGIEQVESFLR